MSAKISRKAHTLYARVLLRQIVDDLKGSIHGMVVDDQPFPVHVDAMHGLAQSAIERR